jgi:hypothetical protein
MKSNASLIIWGTAIMVVVFLGLWLRSNMIWWLLVAAWIWLIWNIIQHKREPKPELNVRPLSAFERKVFNQAWQNWYAASGDERDRMSSSQYIYMPEGGDGFLPGFYQVSLNIPALALLKVRSDEQ